jgi:uncharacterized membrane protein YebE (DUF533 family)
VNLNGKIAAKMNIPQRAANNYTTEQLLETALALLDNARREQNNAQLPIDHWLTNNFTLEIIRAKVAANKANATINV